MTVKSNTEFDQETQTEKSRAGGRQKDERNGNIHHKCKYI